jgi:hypothetical protein
MTPVIGSIVATPVALLEYVIAPLLAVVGVGAVTANGTSPYVFDAVTANADNDADASETVSSLVVIVAEAYWAVSA